MCIDLPIGITFSDVFSDWRFKFLQRKLISLKISAHCDIEFSTEAERQLALLTQLSRNGVENGSPKLHVDFHYPRNAVYAN